MKNFILVLFSVLVSPTGLPGYQKGNAYDPDLPDVVIMLPSILHEISGITFIDNSTIACIQDEKGILFIYDIVNNKLKSQRTFSTDGDYEGIARAGKTIYVLRSDGTLFEIADYSSAKSKVSIFNTGIPAKDNEGLCYDQKNNRLLIACKGKTGDEDKIKNKRFIYAFNLKTKTLVKDPLFVFDVKELRTFAEKQKKGGEGKDPDFNLETSAIAIHPLSGKLYLLSASDNLLFVFNMNGTIDSIVKLKNKIFPQAEGITFMPEGDMLISNEGRDKEASLLRFNYKK